MPLAVSCYAQHVMLGMNMNIARIVHIMLVVLTDAHYALRAHCARPNGNCI